MAVTCEVTGTAATSSVGSFFRSTSQLKQVPKKVANFICDFRFGILLISGILITGATLQICKIKLSNLSNPTLAKIGVGCGKALPFVPFATILALPSQIKDAKGNIKEFKDSYGVRSKKRVFLNGLKVFDSVVGGGISTILGVIPALGALGVVPSHFSRLYRFVNVVLPTGTLALSVFMGSSVPIVLGRTLTAGSITTINTEDKENGEFINRAKLLLMNKKRKKREDSIEEEKEKRKLHKFLTDGIDKPEGEGILNDSDLGKKQQIQLLQASHRKKILVEVIFSIAIAILFTAALLGVIHGIQNPSRILIARASMRISAASLLIMMLALRQFVKARYFKRSEDLKQ